LGALVDAGGCPVDSDADGLPDGLDRCPDTRPAAAVDAVGCPLARDSDGDGVDDPLDRCPRTAAGTSVDANGCPPLFRGERAPLVLHGVTFEAGRSALQHEAFAILNQVATSLAANPEVRVEIAGHTDNAGGARSNQVLSQARADAVRAYLARRGVSPARMVSRGYGETQPVASNATPEGRAENRRVELRELR
jgi:outer membrane protein OmpA-like peptidoglycan-associated protein